MADDIVTVGEKPAAAAPANPASTPAQPQFLKPMASEPKVLSFSSEFGLPASPPAPSSPQPPAPDGTPPSAPGAPPPTAGDATFKFPEGFPADHAKLLEAVSPEVRDLYLNSWHEKERIVKDAGSLAPFMTDDRYRALAEALQIPGYAQVAARALAEYHQQVTGEIVPGYTPPPQPPPKPGETAQLPQISDQDIQAMEEYASLSDDKILDYDPTGEKTAKNQRTAFAMLKTQSQVLQSLTPILTRIAEFIQQQTLNEQLSDALSALPPELKGHEGEASVVEAFKSSFMDPSTKAYDFSTRFRFATQKAQGAVQAKKALTAGSDAEKARLAAEARGGPPPANGAPPKAPENSQADVDAFYKRRGWGKQASLGAGVTVT